ncbi:MAG: L,D-transpeptidase family protein [Cyclobacteriaceae bacterium]
MAVAPPPPPEPLIIPIDSSESAYNGLFRKESVMNYYMRFGSSPIWIKNDEFTPLADSMQHLIRNVQYYGFPTGRYHWNEFATFDSNLSCEDLIRKELLLTDAFLWFSTELQFGLQRSQVSGLKDSLQIELLHQVITDGNLIHTLESLEPVHAAYQSLKEGLRITLDSIRSIDDDSVLRMGKIRLISINLERWRAETSDLRSRYILINIPSFMLEVVENDSTVLSSKVIVGTPGKETPILSSTIECFSIYPYWHVPRKISIEEYLPVIKRDTSFIRRNNFDVLDRKGKILVPDSVEWNKFHENYFPVMLRQREGTENSLGVIKFIFDSPYAVFLHDTNAKRLFRNKERAFSHGCIRMERAIELAHFLVTGVVGNESKAVSNFLKEKERHWVDLRRPIPIYTRYFTCEFKNNALYVYNDVYSKDRVLYELIYNDQDDLEL